MSVLVVGSVALDSIRTPFGAVDEVIGGAATFFSAAASVLTPVQLVAVVGSDYPLAELDFMRDRGVDLAGLVQEEGESFRWAGEYSYDLNSRETLDTRLGVFADFKPRIPDAFRDARWVFLGNIDPELQLDVLEQVRSPGLVACDTMNYWIEGKRPELLKLLQKVDILMVNDSEARELSGDHNLLRAARWIQERGPRLVVVKKGEHGAILYTRDMIFFVPGFPLEEVFDPTGAGDAFAGGFMGYLARCGSLGDGELRRAMVYGSALGSFSVERFGVERLKTLTERDVVERVRSFQRMMSFEYEIIEEAVRA
ncbi:MAG TPA: PfkB family carbohydrate kinase [Longimicrobiales bacterium]|nr:PfkB family carbohydrate kinase [Longimicrobiales bacterium]